MAHVILTLTALDNLNVVFDIKSVENIIRKDFELVSEDAYYTSQILSRKSFSW